MVCWLQLQQQVADLPSVIFIWFGVGCFFAALWAVALTLSPTIRARHFGAPTTRQSAWAAVILAAASWYAMVEMPPREFFSEPPMLIFFVFIFGATIGVCVFAWYGLMWLAHKLSGEPLPLRGWDYAAEEDRPVEKLLEADEKLLWTGRPDPQLFRDEAIGMCVVSFIPTGAGVMCLFIASVSALSPMRLGTAVPLLAGLGFLSIGRYLFLTPWRAPQQLARTVYAITNRRAIVLRLPELREPVYFFTGKELAGRRQKRHSPKRTDLVFGQEEYRRRKGGRYYLDIGFLGLANWQEAERELTRTFG